MTAYKCYLYDNRKLIDTIYLDGPRRSIFRPVPPKREAMNFTSIPIYLELQEAEEFKYRTHYRNRVIYEKIAIKIMNRLKIIDEAHKAEGNPNIVFK